jgi:multidrug efflux pump subunit AcrB
MDIAKTSINHSVVAWMFALILFVGGILSYFDLGQLEDPEFTIKEAMVITSYPGASPEQVEEEVTYPIENALQQLPYIDFIESISSPGMSQITVKMKNNYRKEELRQIWDEVRRKINDLAVRLPTGVMPPHVMDDFGDVYGILLSITGEDYAFGELKDYVDSIRRELVLVDGVGKVKIAGDQKEQVIVEISRSKLVTLGISPFRIIQLLESQNTVSNAGRIKVEQENIRFHSTGEFQQVSELETLIISSAGSSKLIYLGDVAKVTREYAEIPSNIVNFNKKSALLLGISFGSGVNVVEVGERIEKKLAELNYLKPLGMMVNTVYNQPKEVGKSVNSFVLSLFEAVVIVIVVLFVFMGARTGILIGGILIITVFGTFIFMSLLSIELQRISLGALIIALGMLVDNTIVIAEGILIGIKKGKTKIEAASDIVQQTKWPLLGATVIAIIAFAPIGLSSDATGEFAGSLFWVLLISLLLSWITAITLTPFFANLLYLDNKGTDNQKIENELIDSQHRSNDINSLYQGGGYTLYRVVFDWCMHYRKTMMVLLLLLLISAGASFNMVKQSFFPISNTPMFYIDLWRYQGSDIRETKKDALRMEEYLLSQDGVEQVTSTVGRGAPRFMLTYQPEKSYEAYAQLIVRTTDTNIQQQVMKNARQFITSKFPEAQVKVKPMEVGPSTDSKIEARISGGDPEILRKIALDIQDIMHSDNNLFNVRNNWRERTKVIRPQFNEAIARRLGISKSDLDALLLMNFSGKNVGLYRDGTKMLPIIIRSPDAERLAIDSLNSLQIYSQVSKSFIPISQVVDSFETQWEDSLILRRDRKRTITIFADNDVLSDVTASQALQRIKSRVEAIILPTGYSLEWGGEYESSHDARKALMGGLPVGYLVMFIITVLLFNSIKGPLVIWTTVPLAIIGVVFGLLVMDASFSFMALLGLLSLSGMIIKNGIVLIDQINIELALGLEPYTAIYKAGLSRVRPVNMAAITTILGMIPLLFDSFFQSMAVTIMFGLAFATALTLVVVPVLYAVFYRIIYRNLQADNVPIDSKVDNLL